MSRFSYYGRHASPYSSSPGRSPPVITDDDYTYMTPDDIVDPPAGFWPSSRRSANYSASNDSAPDTIFVKHKNQRFTLQFPAFSIGEGFLKVGLVRKYVADTLDIFDPRRIKLVYKNKRLRNDEMPARDAGLKQNSEIVCVVTEGPYDDSGSSGGEGASSVSRGSRVNVDGPIMDDSRSNRIPSNRRDREPSYSNTSNPSTPSRTGFSTATSTTSATGSIPTSGFNRPNNTTSTSTSTPTSSATDLRSSGASYTPPPGPRSPRETVSDLMALFDSKYRPLCQAFIDNPPSDPKARAQEHTKLSETVLAQILLKLDDIQTDGNEMTRRIRKTAVHDTQAVLTQLDRAAGKPSK